MTRHLELQFFIRGGKPENLGSNSGNLGFGIDKYFRFGTPLKDLPQQPTKLDGTFVYASQLLAFRPWSVFAPFEILKVTITKDNKETIRWVQFVGNADEGGGSVKAVRKATRPLAPFKSKKIYQILQTTSVVVLCIYNLDYTARIHTLIDFMSRQIQLAMFIMKRYSCSKIYLGIPSLQNRQQKSLEKGGKAGKQS
mmetsp:Transcript_42294/g.77273  ORF Transcript_42294/g.77273 Transcript_42294/m.77273 type:complete len:196 (-) Transcript_42294:268-855(-)